MALPSSGGGKKPVSGRPGSVSTRIAFPAKATSAAAGPSVYTRCGKRALWTTTRGVNRREPPLGVAYGCHPGMLVALLWGGMRMDDGTAAFRLDVSADLRIGPLKKERPMRRDS
jgi:hypothetical protein